MTKLCEDVELFEQYPWTKSQAINGGGVNPWDLGSVADGGAIDQWNVSPKVNGGETGDYEPNLNITVLL